MGVTNRKIRSQPAKPKVHETEGGQVRRFTKLIVYETKGSRDRETQTKPGMDTEYNFEPIFV